MAEADRVIDVERLVSELKERVDRKRAEGAYAEPFALRSPEHELVLRPAAPAQPALAAADGTPRPAPRISFLPGDRYRSPRRLVGAVISFFRRIVLRLAHPAVDDVARQADAAVVALHARLEWAEKAIAAEARAREDVHFLTQHVERRVEDVSAALAEADGRTTAALDDVRGGQGDLRRWSDELGREQDELRQGQEGVRRGHDDLRKAHDDLQDGQGDLRERQDEVRKGHDELRQLHDDLRKAHDELRDLQEELRERHDDLRHRHGERLDRVETAERAFHATSAETIRGIAEHARHLETRTTEILERLAAVGEEASALARALEALDGDAAGELETVRTHLEAVTERLRGVTASADAAGRPSTPYAA